MALCTLEGVRSPLALVDCLYYVHCSPHLPSLSEVLSCVVFQLAVSSDGKVVKRSVSVSFVEGVSALMIQLSVNRRRWLWLKQSGFFSFPAGLHFSPVRRIDNPLCITPHSIASFVGSTTYRLQSWFSLVCLANQSFVKPQSVTTFRSIRKSWP
jgi:hypothetical protein